MHHTGTSPPSSGGRDLPHLVSTGELVCLSFHLTCFGLLLPFVLTQGPVQNSRTELNPDFTAQAQEVLRSGKISLMSLSLESECVRASVIN